MSDRSWWSPVKHNKTAEVTGEKDVNLLNCPFYSSHSRALWQLGVSLAAILITGNEAHRDSRYPSHNFRLVRERILPRDARTQWVWDKEQFTPLEFAPRARVTVSQFDKIDRPVEGGCPVAPLNSL